MTNAGAANVLEAPVKRLIRIDVAPGYVAVGEQQGAVIGFSNARQSTRTTGSGGPQGGLRSGLSRSPGRDPRMLRMPGPMGMAGGRPGRMDRFSDETESEEEESTERPPDGKLQEDYELSPTGRRSNQLYDVRHATVSLVIDSKSIGLLLANLARVNFMTVLVSSIEDVDEYEHLHGHEGQSYVYGPQDAVKLDMVIETIWLRRWTAGHWNAEEAERLREPFDPGLMPDEVREALTLQPRTARAGTDGGGQDSSENDEDL